MTLRSRLSAAWRAFRQDDFPPLISACEACGAKFRVQCHDDNCPHNQGYGHINTNRDDRLRAFRPSSLADVYGRASMADEVEKIRAEQQADLRHEVATPFGSISFDNAEDAALAKAFNDAKQRQVEHDAEIHSALAVDMSPHPLPSAVDESKLTPDYSNLEVPTIIRRRRKKLASVPKE